MKRHSPRCHGLSTMALRIIRNRSRVPKEKHFQDDNRYITAIAQLLPAPVSIIKARMKYSVFCAFLTVICAACGTVGQSERSQEHLSTIPADPHATTPPQWVNATPPPSLTISVKAEIDLNSVRQTDDGLIEAWERNVFDKNGEASIKYGFQVKESHYLIDCKNARYGWLGFNDRKWTGDLIKSSEVPADHRVLGDIPPTGMIGPEVQLACNQAKKNWPDNPNYDLNIKSTITVTITPLTTREKEQVDDAISQQKENDKHSKPFVKPLLTAQNGKNVCLSMNGVDGSSSPYDLCMAQGMFAHDIYAVRIGGIPILKGIDDSTTTGISGMFYGNPIRLRCEPVSQLANDITSKTIEDGIQYEQQGMKKSTFEERLRHVISTNVVEIGRHCILSNTNGVIAKLDVISP